MNLKMKLCKKGIFCADIKRFWVFSLIYGGTIFFSTFFDFYLNKETFGNSIPYSFVGSRFFAYNCLSNFFGLMAGAILALILFSYLFSTSAISFYHGLPLKRKSIFISKLYSGIFLLTVPVLINFAIVVLTKLCGSTIQIRYISLIYWLGNQLIYSLLTFACVTFAVMLSGNILSLLVTCFLLGIAPLAIIGFVHITCKNYLLGYAYDPTNIFDFIYITPDKLLFCLRGLIYVVAIPVLIIISYFMYKKRDLERCGEAVVFPKVKITFVYFAGLLGGIFSYFYFSIWSFKTLLFMLPFGILAVIVANMINRRSITLKGALKHSLIFTAFVLVLLCSFHFDITGFEKRIPDNIENVTVIPDRYYGYYDDDDMAKYEITDADDIAKVVTYHRYNIEKGGNRDEFAPSNVDIFYTLKNGRTLKRAYKVNYVMDKEYFEPVCELPQLKMLLYPIYHEGDYTIVNIDLHNFLDNAVFYPNQKITDELISAMREDISVLAYDENAALLWNSLNCDAPLYVDITYKTPNSDKPYDSSFYFPISFGFTKTMDLIKKYGYYDIFMTVKYIDAVGIDRNDDEKGEFTLKDYTVDEIITEPQEMQDILDSIQTSYRNPEWVPYDTEQIFDEYIFLDNFGNTHVFGIYRKEPKKPLK